MPEPDLDPVKAWWPRGCCSL